MANFHVIAGADESATPPVVHDIGAEELKDALRKGLEDFKEMPTHLAFIGLIYPVLGICLAALTFSNNAWPLIFPLVSGFALLGPLAAIGLYELSRRRELGLDTSWEHLFDVLRSPSLPSILALGCVLMVIFGAWLATAEVLYTWLYGPMAPESYTGFLYDVLTTKRGWTMIVLGHLIGLVFAAVVFSISVISFPLLLDRDCGAACAVQTSVRTVLMNPKTMGVWALMVAAVLMLGSLPLLVGLAVAMPVLGHASWHLYRKMVEPPAPEHARPVPAN
ncbi:MAG TPA: DUF2189 domain-containing protein [Beijerinckiaceae bacterium]|jgi:uncharacterized membrane protein